MKSTLKKKRVKGYHNIEQRVNQACLEAGHKKVYVIYSAYFSDLTDHEPIDNLDDIAVKGKVVLFGELDEYWGGKKSKPYMSPVLENPTWLEVCVHANAMIPCVRDSHHVFLESLIFTKKFFQKGVKIYEFSMGS